MDTQLQEQWVREGYFLKRHVLDEGETKELLEACDYILAQRQNWDVVKGEPGGVDDIVMWHLNHPAYTKHRPSAFKVLMETIACTKILDVVRTILGEDPLFISTRYFFNPTQQGRDGDWHRDTQLFIKDEEEEKGAILSRSASPNILFLEVSLVANEDKEFVPGSHLRWDRDEEYRIRKSDSKSDHMPDAIRPRLNAGDLAAFNNFGLHRGGYHIDRSRRTLMLTYHKASQPLGDRVTFQQWFLEPGYLEGLNPATRLFFEGYVQATRHRPHTSLKQ